MKDFKIDTRPLADGTGFFATLSDGKEYGVGVKKDVPLTDTLMQYVRAALEMAQWRIHYPAMHELQAFPQE